MHIYTTFFLYFVPSFIISLQHVSAQKPPAYIHPCNNTEPACLTKAAQLAVPEFVKGIPEIGLDEMDPFIINELAFNLPGNLKVTYLNGKVTGFRTCIVDHVEAELQEKIFRMNFHCNITIKGQYTAKGRILLFNINGDGDAKIKIVNLRMNLTAVMDYVKNENGQHNILIKKYKYDFDYGDKITFALTNLFKGNPEISKAVLTFLNENWKLVATEFGKPIVDYAVDLAMERIKIFYKAYPFEEVINVPFVY